MGIGRMIGGGSGVRDRPDAAAKGARCSQNQGGANEHGGAKIERRGEPNARQLKA